ncbi:MAG TPA: endo-1,4-beta-xylanase [Steroidobacteraceae bacterium]|jgi:endo-1,4-beta-xylanase|nr:endo-1,4-beta-xylanase [Steroidobacteraceae bacterium]
MKFPNALLRACLLASVPIVTFAQTEPVIVQAEDPGAILGSTMSIGTDATGTTYVTTALNDTNPPSATTFPEKVGVYTVTFPAPGNYELYARYLIGPGGANDDSWYYGQGFGNSSAWSLVNSGQIGFNVPTQTVYPGGTVGSNQWRWVKVTGAAGQFPTVWTVPAGQLTQTFYWATREDGMLMDKFAFGRQGSWYTVNDLDTGGPATGIEPPQPPPVPPPFTRVGDPLATGHEPKFLGSAHSGGNSLNFGAYWNQVTPENGGKWGTVEGTRDSYNFAQARAAYDQARSNGHVFKWHVLFWGNQQPQWLYDLTPEEQMAEIREWLDAIRTEFPDLEQIEVVNEPLHDPPDRTSAGNTTAGGGSGGYYEALGGAGTTGWDWIINAFTLAREYFPNAKLMLNDYSITNDGNATTRYLQIIQLLKDRGLIDLVGIQGHAFEFNYNNLQGSVNTHTANIARLAAAGLPIYVTEFDIDGVDAIFGVQDDALQLQRYQVLFPLFWENEAIKGMTMWGYVQGGHWRTPQGAWLMYPNGAERPALQWLVRYMENALAVVTPGQVFDIAENSAEGTVAGTVLATDADAGTTLSLWQMTDPSGKFAIDAASGTISLAPGQSLDFEVGASYSVSVSVWDGYRRSAAETVTIRVTNLNDNPPVIAAAQSFRIDDGGHGTIGKVNASDADDTNQPGFTTFSGWKIISGNTHNVFRYSTSGSLQIGRPLLIDWRRTSYSLVSTVSDGENTSAAQAVQVTIPNRVNLCLANVIKLNAPKATAPLLILLGADLGSCSAPR